jgi:hypothetical protein
MGGSGAARPSTASASSGRQRGLRLSQESPPSTLSAGQQHQQRLRRAAEDWLQANFSSMLHEIPILGLEEFGGAEEYRGGGGSDDEEEEDEDD